MSDGQFDVVIIGAGIVGLAVAMAFTRRFPRLRLAVLEKENGLARHQTGHNSGVIHSGIYYKPGSIKARTCVAGASAMIRFCQDHGIPHRVCGKLIVASTREELPGLEELRRRGEANGLRGLRVLEGLALREIEPHCGGVRALHVPQTGITDYVAVSAKYAELTQLQGGEIHTGCEVRNFICRGREFAIETSAGSFRTRYGVNCAGLHSDRISKMAGDSPAVRIIPFRGEYYDLLPDRNHLVRSLIYPVPDPRFPFLGAHLTTRIYGGVDAGPNAVFALKREGYRKSDVNLRDAVSQLSYPGVWRMAARYWRTGLHEMVRSSSKKAFVKSLRKLVPEICESDLIAGDSGVRAQAMRSDGSFVDDFQFVAGQRMLHVLNVPSPAATASIPIGESIVDMLQENYELGIERNRFSAVTA